MKLSKRKRGTVYSLLKNYCALHRESNALNTASIVLGLHKHFFGLKKKKMSVLNLSLLLMLIFFHKTVKVLWTP